MKIWSAALALICLLGLYAAPAAAFTEIEVRQDRDGAGPSHIFHLHDGVLAVVDPLDGTVSAYADRHGTPLLVYCEQTIRSQVRAYREAAPGA